MPDRLAIYYDYTCPYSYRAAQWLWRVRQAGRAFDLAWKPFALKEVNRPPGAPSHFAPSATESVGILALELAQAATAAGAATFTRYHGAVFAAMHADGRRVTADGLLALAREAGVATTPFLREREAGRWLRRVAREHREGLARWHVFGTPTLVVDDAVATYLKFAAAPASPADAAEVYDALLCLGRRHPELVEIKRPQAAT